MFNTYTYNTGLYNDKSKFPSSTVAEEIEFNQFGLQNANIVVSDLFYQSMPSRALDVRDVPRGDGRTILSDFKRTKQIIMRGHVKDDTACLLDTRIDLIKKNLVALEGSLTIKDNCGEVKEFISTLVNGENIFANKRGFNITFTPFEFVFDCYDPFGKSLEYNIHDVFGETALIYNDILNNVGTFTTKPVIIIVFSAASGITNYNFKNNENNDEIEITAAINASDVLEIDSEQQFVKLNGVEIDYDGVFPEFGIGESSFTQTLTGSSANWTLTIKHKTTFL